MRIILMAKKSTLSRQTQTKYSFTPQFNDRTNRYVSRFKLSRP